jgi:Fusaric acid resistance protein-like
VKRRTAATDERASTRAEPFARRGSQLRSAAEFSLRMTVSALAAFSVVQFVAVPLHGIWAVLTAVILTQASVGGSIRASLDYVLGTFAGAVYASLVSLLIPHSGMLATGGVLALSIAPLAYAAARKAAFRAAPFTAVVVLLLAGELGEGPFTAALIRLLEVALGGTIAVAVSLLIFPERAYTRAKQTAAEALEQLARALPVLLAGSHTESDPDGVQSIQDELGGIVTAFDQVVAETRHEPVFGFGSKPNAGPLSRTLLRLRHDLVILGRASAERLPDALAQRLAPRICSIARTVSRHFCSCAEALTARQPPPQLSDANAAIDAYGGEVSRMREEGMMQSLSTDTLEQIFTLGFALERLRSNLIDLERCIGDWRSV